MKCWLAGFRQVLRFAIILSLFSVLATNAQQSNPRPRQFPPGTLSRIGDLPSGRLRTHIQGLPLQARQRALDWLRSFHFTELDLKSLEVDSAGGPFYIY